MPSSERSARARFLLPRLWAVNMESFGSFEGRGLPADVALPEGVDRRDERVEVKTWLLGPVAEVDLAALGRGCP